MFFKREKAHVASFSELTDVLKKQGFATQSASGGVQVSRHGCAAIVSDKTPPQISKPGLLLGAEIGVLVDAGYQKYWLAPSGARAAATAEQLRALHDFEEDLREGLGLISLYNESLGTTNELHLYDRVKDRDHGVPKRAWER